MAEIAREQTEVVGALEYPGYRPGYIYKRDRATGLWTEHKMPRGFGNRFVGTVEKSGNNISEHPHACTEGPHLVSYSEEFDSFYCSVHFVWMSSDPCATFSAAWHGENHCYFHGRPARPGRG